MKPDHKHKYFFPHFLFLVCVEVCNRLGCIEITVTDRKIFRNIRLNENKIKFSYMYLFCMCGCLLQIFFDLC